MADKNVLVEVIGEGALFLSANGQGMEAIEKDPVAVLNRPPNTGWCDTSHLGRYEGTDFCQWYGRRSDGRFYPWGKILRLTEAGKTKVQS